MSLDEIVKRMSDQVLQIWIESCGVNPDLSHAVYLALVKEQERRGRLDCPTRTFSNLQPAPCTASQSSGA